MKNLLFLGFIISLIACDKGPKEINYGHDDCSFCHMTIVDNIHAAELVTDKGKAYTFDSMECLVNFMKENKNKYTQQLTNYFEEPGKLIPIKEAFLLKSDQLPSPMGGNVTAFKTQEKLQQLKKEKGGEEVSYEKAQEILKR